MQWNEVMKKVFPYLMYAGSLPFVLCATCFITNTPNLYIFGPVEKILSIYGLIILSFLSGIHWGQHLYINKGIWLHILPIFSNIIVLSIYFCVLVLDFKMLVLIFILSFIIILIIDYNLMKKGLISNHYFQTRFSVSVIVIISLIISGVL